MAIDLGDAFHRGLIRLSKRVQIIIAQMNWEKEYIEDEIEMEQNSDSDVWSCYRSKYFIQLHSNKRNQGQTEQWEVKQN